MPLLSDVDPFEPARSEAQLAGLLELLGNQPRHVLDLGCGEGRMLLPLAAQGHHCIGVDQNEAALQTCKQAVRDQGVSVELLQFDFLDFAALRRVGNGQPFDAVICLGNTFMAVDDVDQAVGLAMAVCDVLRKPGGMLVLDDIPGEYWPEVAEGYWQTGLSEDESAQFVWAEDDAVFTIRSGDAVDPECVSLQPADRRLRLWTMGDLKMLARLAGLSAPEALREVGLLIMRSG